ncbi:hypothetical protein NDU88_002321 [Pleurodeles waltl]|uniref:Uncharacterized protein n=1 Tax=Pleurodeles waltl TaxID=8319 RepID=A0AAV7P7Y5_PLEWA|nr:hypothetical protein NDU88_002321 [Pleurodeles waltl]
MCLTPLGAQGAFARFPGSETCRLPYDDKYVEYAADHHMEECLVEALDFHVQDSVNKALVKALCPFAQPIFNYSFRHFGACSGSASSVEVNLNEPGKSNADPFEQTIESVLMDCGYGSMQRQEASSSFQASQQMLDDATSSEFDVNMAWDKPQGKSKPKSHYNKRSSPPPPSKDLQLNPDNIVHPQSTE